jgi:spoIIIJ-associated protein
MNKQREFEGKDLEEALKAASEGLGIPEPDLDYRILEQGRRGLMGLGAKNVRILVMPPVSHDMEAHREVESVAEATPPGNERRRPPRRSNRGRGRRGNRQRGRRGKRPPAGNKPAGPLTAEAEEMLATVQKMLELMDLELEVRAEAVDSGVSVHFDGPDRNMLTQKDGELINALQFLLNRMAHRAWPDSGRIHLSSNGERRQRDEELIELAKEVAQQVAGTGEAKRLHPMNAYERRLVHIAVREFTELGSRSEGNGYMKRVKIYKISNKLPT